MTSTENQSNTLTTPAETVEMPVSVIPNVENQVDNTGSVFAELPFSGDDEDSDSNPASESENNDKQKTVEDNKEEAYNVNSFAELPFSDDEDSISASAPVPETEKKNETVENDDSLLTALPFCDADDDDFDSDPVPDTGDKDENEVVEDSEKEEAYNADSFAELPFSDDNDSVPVPVPAPAPAPETEYEDVEEVADVTPADDNKAEEEARAIDAPVSTPAPENVGEKVKETAEAEEFPLAELPFSCVDDDDSD